MLKKWIFLLLILMNSAFADPMVTKVVQLNYVQAGKVIQLIKPLLQPDERVTGEDGTLVLKVSPQTLTQIRQLLHQIDVPPVSFNVSIYQGDPNWLSAQNQNTTVYSTQPQSEQLRSQSVNVMSGESAFISTDQEVPIVTSVGAGWNAGVSYQQHNIKNGLLVVPVLRGSQVELKVQRLREQMNPAGNQQFDNQKLSYYHDGSVK